MKPLLILGVLVLAVVLMVLGVRGCISEPPVPRDPASPPEYSTPEPTRPAIQYPNEPAIQYPNEPAIQYPNEPADTLPPTGGLRL